MDDDHRIYDRISVTIIIGGNDDDDVVLKFGVNNICEYFQ